MALIVRFFDPVTGILLSDTYAESAKVSIGLSRSSEWSANFPANLRALDNVEEGSIVEIKYNGTLVLRGFVQDIDRSYVGTQSIQVSGRDDIDTLYGGGRASDLFIENVSLLDTLYLLLESANWRVGDISTVIEKDETVTIDVRNERNILTQVNKLLGEANQVYYRRGDDFDGLPSLELGAFGEDSRLSFYSPALFSLLGSESSSVGLITDFKVKTSLNDIAYCLEAIGGNVKTATTERPLNLGDALTNDPTLLTDPDFPIIVNRLDRQWRVYNTAKGKPGGIVETMFDESATGTSVIIMGDQDGAAEQWFFTVFVFRPVPGKFEYFEWHVNTVTAQFVSEVANNPFRYELFEIPVNWNENMSTITERLEISDWISTIPAQTSDLTWRWTSETQPELDYGRLYGVMIRTQIAPIANIPQVTALRYPRVTNTDIDLESFAIFRANANLSAPDVMAMTQDLVGLYQYRVKTLPVGIVSGESAAETFSEYTPQNDGNVVTQTSLNAAGAALYARCLAYLLDRETAKRTFNMKAIGLDQYPRVGDMIFVSAHAETAVDDPAVFDAVIQRFKVEGYLRVLAINLDFSNSQLQIAFDVQEGSGLTLEDEVVSLYDEAHNTEKLSGKAFIPHWDEVGNTVSVAVSGEAPDTTLSDGTLAKLVTIPAISLTGKVIGRMAALPYVETNDIGKVRLEVVEYLDVNNPTQVQVAVAIGRGWTILNSITVYQRYLWR